MSKYIIQQTKQFKKSLKLAIKQGRDISKMSSVINNLADGLSLPDFNRDHQLTPSRLYKNCRECHIEPDWLLIYRIYRDELILVLVDTGSHSSLFGG